MPIPESPVATYTLWASSGLRPMNARPSIVSITCPDHRQSTRPRIGEALAHPRFEPCESRVGVAGLPGLVILAADDEDVDDVIVIAAELPLAGALQPHVVIRIVGVPVERVRDRARRNAGANRVGVIGRLFCVDRDQVVEGRIGGDDNRAALDRVAGGSRDLCGLTPRADAAVVPE